MAAYSSVMSTEPPNTNAGADKVVVIEKFPSGPFLKKNAFPWHPAIA
jgi:hypothetical protein